MKQEFDIGKRVEHRVTGAIALVTAAKWLGKESVWVYRLEGQNASHLYAINPDAWYPEGILFPHLIAEVHGKTRKYVWRVEVCRHPLVEGHFAWSVSINGKSIDGKDLLPLNGLFVDVEECRAEGIEFVKKCLGALNNVD